MAVGNADAHAKNFSVLHEQGEPAVRLAPLYDVLSTIALELTGSTGQVIRADTHLGQRVGGGDRDPDQVLAAVTAISGDARVLGVIREQAERISRG